MLRVPQNRDEEKNYALESATSDGYIYGPLDIYDVNEDMIFKIPVESDTYRDDSHFVIQQMTF